MASRIRLEPARQADLWQIHDDGFELGITVLEALQAEPGPIDSDIVIRYGISIEKDKRLRQAMGRTPDKGRPSSSA